LKRIAVGRPNYEGKAAARRLLLCGFLVVVLVTGRKFVHAQSTQGAAPTQAEIWNRRAQVAVRVSVQSPAETETELQIICLFRSEPSNTLQGSLIETNEKLKGLLEQIRKPDLFGGELGETLLLRPPAGTLGAKRLLLIGLGDSEGFTPKRMELVGSIAYREGMRLDVAQLYFAPTVRDGGVTKFAIDEVAEQFMTGWLRGARTDRMVKHAGAATAGAFPVLTFLAGPANASSALQGIQKAMATEAARWSEPSKF
jgi:hypothetical protein